MRASRFAFLGLAFVACLAHAQEAGKSPITGIWEGTLTVNGAIKVRLAFHIDKKPDGSLTATLDSPDQGAKGIPCDSATFADGKLTIEIKKLKVNYVATLAADGKTISGTFTQGAPFPLEMKRVDKVTEVNRPQNPKKPYPYRTEEVTYENKAGGVKFAGTLTLPQGEGPFPAVLLITGSGAQDRDETLLNHKPFLVIADHLTRKGIAVLRVDDRGVGGSTGNTMESTSADFAGDVLAGVTFLKTCAEIDAKKIGLMGHSEGGIIGPLVASQAPDDIAFVVMLAGTGLPGDEILYLQADLIAKVLGADDKARALNARLQKEALALVRQEKDLKVLAQKLKDLVKAHLDELTDEQKKELEGAGGRAALDAQMSAVLTPWFRHFLTYDPRPALRKVRCPVLALNGEKDLQVPPKENLPEIAKALKEAGNKDVTVKELPGLNHLFQHCKTGSPAEYGDIEETFSPEALEIITKWIQERTAKK